MNYSFFRRHGGFMAIVLTLHGVLHGAAWAEEAVLSPTETARQAFEAAANNRPELVFDLLPPSYQKDVESLVIAFADSADPETWNKTRALIGKISSVLLGQQDLLAIVIGKHMPSADDPHTLKEGLEALSAMTGHWASSGMSDLERLRQGNLRQLLATEGQALMAAMERVAGFAPDRGVRANVWASAQAATVELVSADENTAVIRTAMGDETEDIQLVRIEDRWIPEEMAQNWQTSVAEMRRNIAAMDFSSPQGQQRKQMATMMLETADNVLSQIKQARTVEDIDRIVAGMMALMMGGAGMQP